METFGLLTANGMIAMEKAGANLPTGTLHERTMIQEETSAFSGTTIPQQGPSVKGQDAQTKAQDRRYGHSHRRDRKDRPCGAKAKGEAYVKQHHLPTIRPTDYSGSSLRTQCKHKRKRPLRSLQRRNSVVFLLAAGEGFEPSQTESESVVLPLHNPAISTFSS